MRIDQPNNPDGSRAPKPVTEDLDKSVASIDKTTLDEMKEETSDHRVNRSPNLPEHPDYEFSSEIARGGMGRVLAGREILLDREVAIKTLLPGADSARFMTEARITARLPHPGIPPVYALGMLKDGSPFLAMKLVRGTTLAKSLASRSDLKIELPLYIQVFQQVAQAVGFAHEQRIIHRDLKPANIMVGAFGEVQVMDWGLAKDFTRHGAEYQDSSTENGRNNTLAQFDETIELAPSGQSTDVQTRIGVVLGTPAYMAPEQARGEAIDASADVFALGGILYTILTGHAPFEGKIAHEVIQRAGAADLAEANEKLRSCGADLELIELCGRCLQPIKESRPENGQAVADALTSYIMGVQDRLQAAERDRAVAVAREAEQRKRRKVQLALAVAVVSLVVVGGLFGWWRNEQARSALMRDERNAKAVAGLLMQGEEALRAGNKAKAQVALEAAQKRSSEGGAEEQKEQAARLAADLALSNDLDKIDRFRWTWDANSFVHPEIVARKTKDALMQFGADPDGATVGEVVALVSNSAIRERIVMALDRLVQGPEKSTGALAVLQRVDADPYRNSIRDALFAEDHPALIELVGQDAALSQPPSFAEGLGSSGLIDKPRWRQVMLETVSRHPDNLSLLMSLGITSPDGMDGARERLRWYQAAVATAPENPAAHNNLGLALNDLGNAEMAISCWYRAIELDTEFVDAHVNLGSTMLELGRLDEAMERFERAIDLDPTGAVAHSNLGTTFYQKGMIDKAIEWQHKALALDPQLAMAHVNLGNALARQGQPAEAISSYEKAIAIAPESAQAYTNLANQLARLGRLDDAVSFYNKSLALDSTDPSALNNLGITLTNLGRKDEAIACFENALSLNPNLGSTYSNLAGAMWSDGELDKAIDYYQKAIELGASPAMNYCNMGSVLRIQGRLAESLAAYQQGHTLGSKQSGWSFPSAEWLAEAEELVAVEAKLPEFLNGEYQPSDNDERLMLASVCNRKKLHRKATEVYEAVFEADAGQPEANKLDRHYSAAGAAALAASGEGEDAENLDEVEQKRLRKLALDWLRADLIARQQRLQRNESADRVAAQQALSYWLQDSELASLRDSASLALLSVEEREAFSQFWADVTTTLGEASK